MTGDERLVDAAADAAAAATPAAVPLVPLAVRFGLSESIIQAWISGSISTRNTMSSNDCSNPRARVMPDSGRSVGRLAVKNVPKTVSA